MKLSNLLFVLPAVILFSLTAKAQEETPILEGPDPAHRELNYNEDKSLIYDQAHHQPGLRDSMSVIAPKPVNRAITRPEMPREGQKPKHEDDALRFNFLYYIIQKYKISDIIEN